MLEKIAKWLTRKPKLVALCAVIMLVPALIGYVSTRINYDILSYLPEELESSQGERLLEAYDDYCRQLRAFADGLFQEKFGYLQEK